jgi:putative nucleotidyltransferase with HDIG domain
MKAHEMVAKVRTLPSVSPSGLKLLALLGQPSAANDEIVEVVRLDPVLTAKLLRACNSPALGFQETVVSVEQAVWLLGYNEIQRMVTTLAMAGALSVRLPGYDVAASDLWRHSLLTASAADNIVKLGADPGDASAAFTAGLLHDLGKLIVGQFLTTESGAAVHRLTVEGLSTAEAERKVFGTDHAEVGSCLLYLWRLPASIIEAVANHHQPVLEPQPRFSAVAYVANCVAHVAEATPGSDAYRLFSNARALECLGLKAEELESLGMTARAASDRVEQFVAMAEATPVGS